MEKLVETLSTWLHIIPRITVGNVIEILIIAVLIYAMLAWIKDSRSWVLLRGLLVIFFIIVLCELFNLDTILWIFEKLATVAVIALIVIFQPELRKALERLGSGGVIQGLFKSMQNQATGFTDKSVNEIVRAAFELSKTKTGALIVIENTDSLVEIERTGIEIDGKITSQLLINIFEHNTPLHDGAVVIRDNLITAATCYLPLSDNMNISKSYGTRHRAALGMSESSDSITVVVSEETGDVSVTREGQITKMHSADELREVLKTLTGNSGKGKRRLKIKKRKVEHGKTEGDANS